MNARIFCRKTVEIQIIDPRKTGRLFVFGTDRSNCDIESSMQLTTMKRSCDDWMRESNLHAKKNTSRPN